MVMVARDNFRVNQAGSDMFGLGPVEATTDTEFRNEVLNQLQRTIDLIKNDSARRIGSENGQPLSDHQSEVSLSEKLKNKLKDI